MVNALSPASDPNDIWRTLASVYGWQNIFADGVQLDQLPPELRRKIQARKAELLQEGGDRDKIDTENEIKKFAELLGTELKNIPGMPPGFDPQLLVDYLLNKPNEQN